jgi:hypothetical protein
MTWSMRGTYFESCNCEAACPCVFLSPPTQGNCTVVIGWHIDRGSDDEVDLSGLNVAFAVYSPGKMHEVPWQVAVYLDDRATLEQEQSLVKIFGGQAGGHPARLASHVEKILGVRKIPIGFAISGKNFQLKIGEVSEVIAEVEIDSIAGQNGGDVTLQGHPLAIAPGQVGTLARSKKLEYHDHGFHWSLSGRNGISAPFEYQG